MSSYTLIPDQPRWSRTIENLLQHDGPLWIYGPTGSGVSTLARWLAEQRRCKALDDPDPQDSAALEAWLIVNPKGIVASHYKPEDPDLTLIASHCLAFRMPALEEDPASVETALRTFARDEGLDGPLPPALWALPCPGNLRGLRNRLLRWKLLGQLPDEEAPKQTGSLPLDAEDMATNLHALERILLHRALRRSYGNRVEAAKRLGVSRRQLYLLIARHGDPVKGEAATEEGPKRLRKRRTSP